MNLGVEKIRATFEYPYPAPLAGMEPGQGRCNGALALAGGRGGNEEGRAGMAGLGGHGSVLEAWHGLDASLEGVFEQVHVGGRIRNGQQGFGGCAAGDDDVLGARPGLEHR